uniref:BACK domain-containing protein n=1 Tax=Tetradesmus obliquus TaxID=3088 RepID=A0A383VVS3_TETOB|eukprot:jgi/Sobl393_1/2295/SZX69577.1
MVGVNAAAQEAVQALTTAARSQGGLSAAATEALATLPAWPACLLQLLPTIMEHAPCCKLSSADLAPIKAAANGSRIQQLLLAVFGDLEAVWADAQLRQMLLGLPLPAMQLLLSSGELCVASEDTVLFAAQQYVAARHDVQQLQAITAALAPLVRAPQLSMFAVSSIVLLGDLSKHLLAAYSSPLRALASLQRVVEAGTEGYYEYLGLIPSAPASWRLGSRQIRPAAGGVRLEWRLPVEQLRQACRDSFAQKKPKLVICDVGSNLPVYGLQWTMASSCILTACGAVVVNLMAAALGVPPGMFAKNSYTMTCGELMVCDKSRELMGPDHHTVCGNLSNTAGLQPLTGDAWDEAAWAAAGLPTSGELLLRLQVHSVE